MPFLNLNLFKSNSFNINLKTLIHKKLQFLKISRQVIFGIFYLFLLFRWTITFNYTEKPTAFSEFLFVSSILIVTSFIVEWVCIRRMQMFKIIGFLVSFLLFIHLFTFSKSVLNNEHLCTLYVIILMSFFFLPTSKKSYKTFLQFSSIICLFLISVCLVYLFFGVSNELFTAGFLNSGVFCIYISLHLPFIWYLIQIWFGKKSATFRLSSYSIILSAVTFICYRYESRTAMLIVILISLLIAYSLVNKLLHKRVFLIFALGVLTLIFIFFRDDIYEIKSRSVDNRILSSKIAVLYSTSHFVSGIGVGKFPLYYPFWQAQYFKTQHNSRETISAGETYNIFNEPLLLFIELGFIKTMIVILLGIYYLNVVKRTVGYEKSVHFIYLLAFILSSIFYYSFHVSVLVFTLFYGIKSIYSVSRSAIVFKRFVTLSKGLGFFILFLLIYNLTLSFKYYRSIDQWKKIQNSSYNIHDLAQQYSFIYPELRDNGRFLYDYTKNVLLIHEMNLESQKHLRESLKSFPFIDVFNLLAFAERKLGNKRSAAKLYTFVSNYLPYKFKPKLELMYLYAEIDSLQLARQYAKEIVTMPVKIQSEEVLQIKKEAQIFLTKNLF